MDGRSAETGERVGTEAPAPQHELTDPAGRRVLEGACSAALRPGGRVLFSMPNMEAWAARAWARFSPRNWSRHVLHDAASLRRACAAAGLEFEREFHFGGVALQMAAWEHPGLVPALLGFGQRVVRYASRRLGIAIDSRRLSQHRWVLARRGSR